MTSKIVLCMGTRPEIIKMAPVAKAFDALGVKAHILHTGQHEEMAWPLYEFFQITPTSTLKLGGTRNTLSGLSAELLTGIAQALTQLEPHALLAHGDTTSALMGSLAAFYQRIPVGHVEAGLRSGSLSEPFPEELNRSAISRIAAWHFAPTKTAVSHLANEGVRKGISCVGNTVVDAVQWAAQHMDACNAAKSAAHSEVSSWLLNTGSNKLLLITAHRRENWGEPMRNITQAALGILQHHADVSIIWPVHLNPIVKQEVEQLHAQQTKAIQSRWLLTKPLDYVELVNIMRRSTLILTDSGGIQEEAASLKVPVLVLRNVTERPELLSSGAGKLVGTETKIILGNVNELLTDSAVRNAMQTSRNPFGDGHAAMRIAARVLSELSYKLPEPHQHWINSEFEVLA